MRRTLILLASLTIIVLGMWGSAVILLDEERLKGMVAEQFMQQTGRKVEIRGALRLEFFPRMRLHAQQVLVSGPDVSDHPRLLEADSLSISLRLLSLIRGDLSAGQVNVQGATLNLSTDGSLLDSSEFLDLAAMPITEGERRDMLSTRQMRLEDVRVVLTDLSTEQVEAVQIDFVELDRFAFDRSVQFNFLGNLGEPPLFEQMAVQGLLHVPSDRRMPVRLSSLHMAGRLNRSGQQLVLTGQLALSPALPLQVLLTEGRLEVGGQSLSVAAAYDGSGRSHLDLSLVGNRIDSAVLIRSLGLESNDLLAFMRGMDLDLVLNFDRLNAGSLALDGLEAEVVGRNGLLSVKSFTALMPGAMTRAAGIADLTQQPPASEFRLHLEWDEVSEWLSARRFPAIVTGSGVSQLQVALTGWPGSWQSMEASGQFEVWEGRWLTRSAAGQSAQALPFHRLAGQYRLEPGNLDIAELMISTPDFEALGWAAVDLADQSVRGHFVLVEDGSEVDVSGSLEAPEFSSPLLHSSGDHEADSEPSSGESGSDQAGEAIL